MKGMRISYAANKSAPEQFSNLKVYNQPFKLDSSLMWRLGYKYSTEGHKACLAEIKRLYRASLRKRRLCTIGFMLEGSKRDYCFTRSLSAYDDSLQGKLRIYKEFKLHLLESGGKYESAATAELGANYKIESVVKHYQTADLSRPVKIYFRD